MSESETESFDCRCGWSGQNPLGVRRSDRVLHHGESMSNYGGGVTYSGPVYGTYYAGFYGSYNGYPECGNRVLTSSQKESERKLDKTRGLFAAGLLGFFMMAVLLEEWL